MSSGSEAQEARLQAFEVAPPLLNQPLSVSPGSTSSYPTLFSASHKALARHTFLTGMESGWKKQGTSGGRLKNFSHVIFPAGSCTSVANNNSAQKGSQLSYKLVPNGQQYTHRNRKFN